MEVFVSYTERRGAPVLVVVPQDAQALNFPFFPANLFGLLKSFENIRHTQRFARPICLK